MMLHPSYSDLMKVVNNDSDSDTPVVNSRYSIVMATAKRARQIIARQSHEEMKDFVVSKPLSKAVDELYSGQMKILPGDEDIDAHTAAQEDEAEEETEEKTEEKAEEEEEKEN